MSDTEDEAIRKDFAALHNPDRPVYHIGHARRANKAEDYNSSDILAMGKSLLSRSIEVAHGVIANFAKHSRKAS